MEKTAKLKTTNDTIKVYKSKLRDTWINSKDCTTEYKPEDLIFD